MAATEATACPTTGPVPGPLSPCDSVTSSATTSPTVRTASPAANDPARNRTTPPPTASSRLGRLTSTSSSTHILARLTVAVLRPGSARSGARNTPVSGPGMRGPVRTDRAWQEPRAEAGPRNGTGTSRVADAGQQRLPQHLRVSDAGHVTAPARVACPTRPHSGPENLRTVHSGDSHRSSATRDEPPHRLGDQLHRDRGQQQTRDLRQQRDAAFLQQPD